MINRLCIVIVNWNSGSYLNECLSSIPLQSHRVASVVVVDNASTDNSFDLTRTLQKNDPKILYHKNSENLGFGAACNIGVKLAHVGDPFDTILFLNPDTALSRDTFDLLWKNSELHDPRYGIFGIRLWNEDGIYPSCSNFPSVLNMYSKTLGLSKIMSLWPRSQHHLFRMNYSESKDVDQVMGAFFIIRAELFEKLNGFDQQFFVYFEEVDLCFRARQSGYLTRYLSSPQAYHASGGSTRHVKPFRLYLNTSSRLRYFSKHHSSRQLRAIKFLTFVIEPIARTVFSLLRLDLPGVAATFRAYATMLRCGFK